MAQSYVIFDFGTDEEAAQQARHRVEAWRQAFRLGDKMQLKFERRVPEKKDGPEQIRVLVRLDFSDHEKLSHQRWLERLQMEAPFKDASPEVVRGGDVGFFKTGELFDSLP